MLFEGKIDVHLLNLINAIRKTKSKAKLLNLNYEILKVERFITTPDRLQNSADSYFSTILDIYSNRPYNTPIFNELLCKAYKEYGIIKLYNSNYIYSEELLKKSLDLSIQYNFNSEHVLIQSYIDLLLNIDKTFIYESIDEYIDVDKALMIVRMNHEYVIELLINKAIIQLRNMNYDKAYMLLNMSEQYIYSNLLTSRYLLYLCEIYGLCCKCKIDTETYANKFETVFIQLEKPLKTYILNRLRIFCYY